MDDVKLIKDQDTFTIIANGAQITLTRDQFRKLLKKTPITFLPRV